MKIGKREMNRLNKLLIHERLAYSEGFKLIAGVDEAGRGPLAGPVVAAACYIPEGIFIPGVNDSKLLTADVREKIFHDITSNLCIAYGIGIVSSGRIDEINIYQASIEAMLAAVNMLGVLPDYLLVDGLKLPHQTIPSKKIIGGDALSQSIAAASILAKVTRDRLMIEYHKQWPEYGFSRHKGYGTKGHQEALAKHGPCPIHRRSFEPVQNLLSL